MKNILILTILILTGCNSITSVYTVCTRDNSDWVCKVPLEVPFLDVPKHKKQNKITCIRRPKLDRMIMSDWRCIYTPKGGLPMDFPIGYLSGGKIK